ncbi:TetR/AcrR family transcriptional regulator [Nocardioides hungaricus]
MSDKESAIGKRRRLALELSRPEYVEKREQILRAAADLFATRGYRETSVSDIAEAVELDRATLYYYVGSKSDLFEAIAITAAEGNVEWLEEIVQGEEAPDAKLGRAVEHLMVSYAENFPNLYIYIREHGRQLELGKNRDSRMRAIQKRYDRAFALILEEGRQQGLFNDDLPMREIGYSIAGMVNWSHYWFRPGGPVTGESMGKALSTLVLQGIRSGPVPAGQAGDSSAT